MDVKQQQNNNNKWDKYLEQQFLNSFETVLELLWFLEQIFAEGSLVQDIKIRLRNLLKIWKHGWQP